jgi:hypothetical protein
LDGLTAAHGHCVQHYCDYCKDSAINSHHLQYYINYYAQYYSSYYTYECRVIAHARGG